MPQLGYSLGRDVAVDINTPTGKPSQYMMRAAETSWRAGIKKGAILVIDTARKPIEGSIVIASICGEFCMKRMRLYPTLCLQMLDQPDLITLIEGGI